jgi:hypothetical protein
MVVRLRSRTTSVGPAVTNKIRVGIQFGRDNPVGAHLDRSGPDKMFNVMLICD